jgi:hypothetical protein
MKRRLSNHRNDGVSQSVNCWEITTFSIDKDIPDANIRLLCDFLNNIRRMMGTGRSDGVGSLRYISAEII